jgi:HlyD family secretion protein
MEDYKMRVVSRIYILIIPILMISCGGNNLPPGGSGLIEATEVVVSAEIGGQLKALYFDEGDKIRNGDTIGLIDTTTVIINLRQSEALKQALETRQQTAAISIEQATYNLELAKKEYDRISQLLKFGSANQQQYDQTETAFNQAQLAKKQALAAYNAADAELAQNSAQMELLNKQLRDCFPLAPSTGTVVNKYVESGELISPGKQLIQIARLDTVWVKVYLSPSDLTKIRLGGSANIDSEDGRPTPLNGTISWISDVAEFTPKNVQTRDSRADLVYAVKIIIPNSDGTLKIGMPVSVEIR